MSDGRFVLASASPRRAELLRGAGLGFDVMVADVDEAIRPNESPEAYVRRVALDKAAVVAPRVRGRRVLAADTAVVIDGLILGKPNDSADAARMLRLLSGRTHRVLTAVVLTAGEVDAAGEPAAPQARVETTTVEFMPLTEAEIEWYVGTGEPMDKAGAYAIQGLASRYISRIDGSYSNVVGLPVSVVYTMLRV